MATKGCDKNGYWFIDFTFNGKRIRKGCGKGREGKALAENRLTKVKFDIAHKKLGIIPEIPFPKFFDYYLLVTKSDKKLNTQKRDEIIKNHFVPFIGGKNLSQISSVDIENYKNHRLITVKKTVIKKKGQKPIINLTTLKKSTVNRELNTIKAAFNKALEWGFLAKNPIVSVKRFKEPRGMIRFFTLEEIGQILNATSGEFRAAIFILLSTGLRRSELINLDWSDIDYSLNSLYVQPKKGWSPKDYESRTIPINAQLKELFLSMDKNNKRVINGWAANGLTKAFRKLLKRLNIENATLHTLRHTFASYLVMSGVDLATVQKLLGHSDIKTTMRYAHLAPDHLQDSAKRLSLTFCRFSAVEKAKTETKGNLTELVVAKKINE